MTPTERKRIQRASQKLEIPSDELDLEVVGLLFGKTNYKEVYSELVTVTELMTKIEAANLTFEEVLDWLDSEQDSENSLQQPKPAPTSSTERKRMQRASDKLGVPTKELDPKIVNLVFSPENSPVVYQLLKAFKEFHGTLKNFAKLLD